MNKLVKFISKKAIFPNSGIKYFSSTSKEVTFKIKDFEDNEWVVKGNEGEILMECGIKCGVPFQKACGGNAECLTCHLYLEDSLSNDPKLNEPTEKELDTLQFSHAYTEHSRLGC